MAWRNSTNDGISLHSGEIVLVTGGSRGLGRALVLEFARHGANVALTYLTEARLADKVVEAAKAYGVEAIAIQANLAEQSACGEIFDGVNARFGGLDILIANAATGVFKPLSRVTARHWQWTISANSLSLVLLTQKFLPTLRERRGNILAISSAGAVRALPNYGVVGASKGALESLVRHLALELGPEGIRVNALSPGLMDTDVLLLVPNRSDILSEVASRTPLRRIATPEDVAAVASFVTSALAGFIHGQVINVDGGYGVVG